MICHKIIVKANHYHVTNHILLFNLIFNVYMVDKRTKSQRRVSAPSRDDNFRAQIKRPAYGASPVMYVKAVKVVRTILMIIIISISSRLSSSRDLPEIRIRTCNGGRVWTLLRRELVPGA